MKFKRPFSGAALILVCVIFSNLSQAGVDSLDLFFNKISSHQEQRDSRAVVNAMIDAEEYITRTVPSAEDRSQLVTRLCLSEIDIENFLLEEDLTRLELARAYEYSAARLLLTGQYQASKEAFHKALEFTKQSEDSYRVYKWLAVACGVTQEFENAIEHYRNAIQSAEDSFDKEDEEGKRISLVLNINLLSIVNYTGDLYTARKLRERIIYYSKSQDDPYYLILSGLAIASVHMATQSPENAILELKKYEEDIDKVSTLKLNYFNYLATAYNMKDEYELAKTYYQKSVDATPDNSPNYSSKLVNLDAIANINFLQKNFSEALASYNNIINVYLSYPGQFNQYLANAYLGRSKVYSALNLLDSANLDIKSSLELKGELKTWKIPYYSHLTSLYASYYEQNLQEAYADSVLWNINRSEAFIDSLRIEYRYLEAEMGLNDFLYQAYAANLESLYKIYKQDKERINADDIFQYFEKIKSYSIKEYLKTDDAVKEGMLPREFLNKERKIKNDLGALKQRSYLLERKLQSKNDSSHLALKEEISKMDKHYVSFLKKIEKEYPDYFKFQYDQYESDLSDIQTLLSDREAVIEYYMARDAIYILSIEKNSYHFYKFAIDKNWKKKLNRFLNLLAEPSTNQESINSKEKREQFLKLSTDLYDDLLEEVLVELDDRVKHLIIIPDNQLNFLPYSTLISFLPDELTSYRDMNYLLLDYSVSYDVSASDFVQSYKDSKNKSGINYVGFSPRYTGKFRDLPYSRKCVEEIAELFKGNAVVDEDATIASFDSSISNSEIIHLAMHGIIDQFNPSLSHFRMSSAEDAKLFVSDIYAKRIDASLAVLSACNTGTGRFRKGDGVQNISRAFRFAGVKSTIMSLWSLPDAQTAQIDLSLFKFLKEGHDKDDALRMAQLNFLATAPTAFVHPYYWAGYIPSGNMEHIEGRATSFSNKLTRIGLLLILISLVVFLIYRKISA